MTEFSRDISADVQATLDDVEGDLILFRGTQEYTSFTPDEALNLLSFLQLYEDTLKNAVKNRANTYEVSYVDYGGKDWSFLYTVNTLEQALPYITANGYTRDSFQETPVYRVNRYKIPWLNDL